MIMKFLGAIGGMLLFVALIFSATTAARLRNEITLTNEALENAENALLQLRKDMDASASIPAQATPIDPPTDERSNISQTDESAEIVGLDASFVLRVQDGKIAVFTADGYLIQTLNINPQTLPAQDRIALETDGIRVFSKKELEEIIRDFER